MKLEKIKLSERTLDWTKKEVSLDNRAERKYKKKMKKALMKQRNKEREQEIKNVESRYKKKREKTRKKIQSSKKYLAFIFINCIVIEVYAMYIMRALGDISALPILISGIVGQAISYAVYALKSFHETKEEEKNKLEHEKFEYEHPMDVPCDNMDASECMMDSPVDIMNNDFDNNVTN